MAILKAIFEQLLFRFLLTTPVVVGGSFAGKVALFSTIYSAVISTLWFLFQRDALRTVMLSDLYKQRPMDLQNSQICFATSSILYFPFRFYHVLLKMGDNLRRAVQDINLGADDEPIALPEDLLAQAAAENRFILMGQPVMPRRQNLCSIVASMPRTWGQSGLVHGRIVPGNQFQFIFPSEESLENVMRRGPWAFNDRMLVLQRWSPLMPLINFIPFWVQIRGIPFQFLNRQVIAHIGRALGQVLAVDYDAEAAARVEFVRVQLHWDIERPLRFQRQFQFVAGTNTLLRFRYERLRGFCEVCGMLTHDSGACLIQNGGEEEDSDGEDDNDDLPPANHHNPGVVIREIVEDIHHLDEVAEEENGGVPNGDEVMLPDIDPDHNSIAVQYESETEENLMSVATGEMDNRAIYPWTLMSPVTSEQDQDQGLDRGKRKREDFVEAETMNENIKMKNAEKGEGSGSMAEPILCRGAVGPKPPLSP